MSYVRWSHKSDVYIYVDVMGLWTVHVASQTTVNGDDIETLGERTFRAYKEKQLSNLQSILQEQKEKINSLDKMDIESEFAGKTFQVGSAKEMVDLLVRMVNDGIKVPTFVIDELMEESLEGE